MQLGLAHFVHSWGPELELKKQLNTLLLVWHLAESLSRHFAIACSVKQFGNSCERHRWVLDLDNLLDLWPERLVTVAFDHVREVELLVQGQASVQVPRLRIHLLLVKSDEVLNQVAQGLVNEWFMRLLEEFNLFFRDVLLLHHHLLQELIFVNRRQAVLSLAEKRLSVLKHLLFVAMGQIVFDLCEVLAERFQSKQQLRILICYLLVFEDVAEEELAGDSPLLGVVTKVAKAVLNIGHNTDHCVHILELRLEDLSEHLVYIVWITAFHGDFESVLELACLEQEGNLLHNLLLVANQILAQLGLARVVGQLSQLGEINAELYLSKDRVAVQVCFGSSIVLRTNH